MYEEIDRAVREIGMLCRGGFVPEPEDGLAAVRAVILIGNAGPAFWRHAAAELAAEANPLDGWTRRRLIPIGRAFGARVLFPFEGPPYWPFQRWARRCEPVFPSPIGPLIHPEYGLWHAYRAAFAFAVPIDLPEPAAAASPCEDCEERPCLGTCPVGALRDDGYDVAACAAHVLAPEGSDCLGLGCRGRRACPVGTAYGYPPDQARHHMTAFAAAQAVAAPET